MELAQVILLITKINVNMTESYKHNGGKTMKKYVLLLVPFFFLLTSINPGSFTLPVTGDQYSTEKKIIFFHEYMFDSPTGLFDINGKYILITQLHNAAVIDIQNGKYRNCIDYTFDDEHARYMHAGNYCFSNGWSSAYQEPLITHFDSGYTKMESFYHFPKIKCESYISYIFGNYAYYKNEDGLIISFSKDGKYFGPDETNQRLIKMHNSYVQHDEVLLTAIKTKRYIIVDGLFYPTDSRNYYEYYETIGYSKKKLDKMEKKHPISKIISVGFDGNIITECGGTEHSITVYSQNAEVLSEIGEYDIEGYDSQYWKDYKQSMLFITSLKNGDIIRSYAVKDKAAYFFRDKNSWSFNYIDLARSGLKKDSREAVLLTLKSMNIHELEIIKNAVYALYGVEPKEWDLQSYFNGFDFYAPKKGMNRDNVPLSDEQRELVNAVIAEKESRYVK
jgi:hypothetical protein